MCGIPGVGGVVAIVLSMGAAMWELAVYVYVARSRQLVAYRSSVEVGHVLSVATRLLGPRLAG